MNLSRFVSKEISAYKVRLIDLARVMSVFFSPVGEDFTLKASETEPS